MLYLRLSWNAHKKINICCFLFSGTESDVALFMDFLKPLEYHQILLVFGSRLFALYQTSSNDAGDQGLFSELAL